jgi:general stress protein 26
MMNSITITIKQHNMSEVKDLSNQEAVTKLKDLAKAADICLFTTALTKIPLSTRPMGAQQVDDEGNIWFFSGKDSHKNEDIEQDNRVQLFFANKANAEYLSIYGEASEYTDKDKARELWNPLARTWFHDGVDDPNLTLLVVKPLDAYYWDTKTNKAVSLVKIAVGAITGKTIDDGVEGKLELNHA